MIVALLGGTPSPRLTVQLARLPDRARARVVAVASGDPLADLARLAHLAHRAAGNGEAIAVVRADLVVSDRPVLDVLDDPRPTSRLLVGPGADVRVQGSVVVAAGSARQALPGPTHGAPGLLHITATDAGHAARAWHAAAAQGWDDLDPWDAAVVAAVRAGITTTAVDVGPYVAGRTPDLLATAEALDEDDLAWRRTSRGGDGVWSTFALRPVSRRITRRAVRAGVTPNQVTVLGFAVGLLAAVLVAFGTVGTIVAGALLLQVSLVLDCVDGEIARSTRRFTPFGAWLDLVTDRVKEYAALAAIAVAADGYWRLAVAALGLQLVRHMADYAFADTVLAQWRRPRPDVRPFADTAAPPPRPGPGGRLGVPTGHGPLHWVKQAVHLQIGERWLVLSVGLLVGTAAVGPQLALIAYTAGVALGLAWVLVGWTIRTIPRRRERLPDDVLDVVVALRDDGASRFRVPRTALAWYLPALVTAAELFLLLDPHDDGTLRWAYLWACAVAWHRYDVFYRVRGGRTPVPRWVGIAGGGWQVRFVVLLVFVQHVPTLLPIGAIWLLLVYVPESLFHVTPRRVPRSLGVLKKELRRAVAVPVIRTLMRVTPTARIALVGGLPDGEENSLVTAVHLSRRYPGEVALVANDPDHARIALDRVAALLGIDAGGVRIVAKKRAFSTFLRAELVLYTHGLYDSPRPVGRRLHVNLWHGTGPKWNANANFGQRIGAQAHSASSPLWGYEAIRALSMGVDTRLVAGNPRQDVLAASTDRAGLAALGLDPDRPLVVWLPTFRRSAGAGLVGLSEGEPLSAVAGRAFAAAAHRHDVQLVAKPHRLDSEHFAALGVTVLTDDRIRAAGTTLYALLGLADGLLSDYSSGWVDLLDTATSIALYIPDLDAYRAARGLNRPDLGVVAEGLELDEDSADGFFAAVAGGVTWRATERRRCVERIELVDVAPGRRTDHMLDELAAYARELFGTDLGLGQGRTTPATSS